MEFLAIMPAFLYFGILLATCITLFRYWNKSKREQYTSDPTNPGFILAAIFFTILGPICGFARCNSMFSSESPFAPNFMLAVELLVVVSGFAYWVSLYYKRQLPTWLNGLLRAAILQGVILDLFVTIHFLNYMGLGLVFPYLGFELLVPPIAGLFLLYELFCNIRINKPQSVSGLDADPLRKLGMLWGLLLVLLLVEQALLIPLGYPPDSLIRAFTESHGFIFS
jgi:hypothetical protein